MVAMIEYDFKEDLGSLKAENTDYIERMKNYFLSRQYLFGKCQTKCSGTENHDCMNSCIHISSVKPSFNISRHINK